MALIPLKIPAGVYRIGTDFEGSGRWRDSNLIRWHAGSMRPVGGWSQKADLSDYCSASPRALHTWIDNTRGSNIAMATAHQLLYSNATGTSIADITPYGFVKGNNNSQVNTGFGGNVFGTGYFGKKRPYSGVFQEADSWSLDNWGEYLVGCSTADGKLYEWTLNPAYGSDIVADGDFAAATGWTVGANWAVTGGVGLYTRTVHTVDASDVAVVDVATDTITITAHGLSDGDQVLYDVTSGQTAIGGLTTGTTYFIVGSTANTFQLAATSGGTAITLTAVGTGTTDTFTDLRHETIEQSLTTSATKAYQVEFTINAVGAAPSVDIEVVGDNTTTVYLTETKTAAGSYVLRFDSADTACTLSFKSTSATGDYFSIDDVIVREAPVALQIANSPTSCKGLIVTEERFIFALQAGGNPRNIAWCDREDNTTWTAQATNEAGDFELTTNGEIMQAARMRGRTIIVTSTDAHIATYQGAPYVYGFERVGTACGAVSRMSLVALEAGAFWMGKEAFYMFDGSVAKQMPCDVQDYIFDNINPNQRTKIWAVHNSEYNEVWWYYPSSGSNECDSYVSYDYGENHWEIGTIDRTTGSDQGVFDEPMWADADGILYNHELHGIGHGSYTPYAESSSISLGNGDQVMKVNQLIGDEKTIGDVQVQFMTRFHPNDTQRVYPSATTYYSLTNMPTSVRFTGRQIRIRVEATSNSDFRVGTMRINAEAGGRR